MALGPISPNPEAINELRKADRLRSVTLRPLLEVGFVRFGWTNPQERPNGLALLADGTDPPGAGAFVYETSDGLVMLYALSTRAVEEMQLRKVVADASGQNDRKSNSWAIARDGAHLKFLSSMGSVAEAAASAAAAAQKLREDLAVWQRGPLEAWVRSYGISFGLYYLVGVAAYNTMEGWEVMDSVYYLTATATTNGDELQPQTTFGKLFSSIYILLGITIVFRGLSPIATFFIEVLQNRVLEPLAKILAAGTDRALYGMDGVAKQLEDHAPAGSMAARTAGIVRQFARRVTNAPESDPASSSGTPTKTPLARGRSASMLPRFERASSVTALVGNGSGSTPGGAPVESSSTSAIRTAILSAMVGYFRAGMLVLIVGSIGVALACFVHGYTAVDALFWTVGCMTTAGGDLHADTHLLQILYTFYMPLAAVAALTAARTLVETSFLREIRLDRYDLKVHSLLMQEAQAHADPNMEMRESDFVLAVLRQRQLVDMETIDAIKQHFADVVRRSGDLRPFQRAGPDYDPVIDAHIVFRHLVRQGWIRPLNKKLSKMLGIKGSSAAAPAGADASRGHGDVMGDVVGAPARSTYYYVDMTSADEGFGEWYARYWEKQIIKEPQDGAPGPAGAAETVRAPNVKLDASGRAQAGYSRLDDDLNV